MIKSTLAIITATATVMVLAGTLFLNSILGAFGLVTTSVENLSKLTASQQAIDKMKQKHKSRKSKVTKRFAKRTGKRVASSAIAAATIGTVAVVTVVAGLEVLDYCDEKEALTEEGNILYDTDNDFDYESCMNESMEDARQIVSKAIDDSSEVVKKAWDDVLEWVSD